MAAPIRPNVAKGVGWAGARAVKARRDRRFDLRWVRLCVSASACFALSACFSFGWVSIVDVVRPVLHL